MTYAEYGPGFTEKIVADARRGDHIVLEDHGAEIEYKINAVKIYAEGRTFILQRVSDGQTQRTYFPRTDWVKVLEKKEY